MPLDDSYVAALDDSLQTGSETLAGRLVGIDDEGCLIVVTDGGQMRRVLSGEVRRVRRAL